MAARGNAGGLASTGMPARLKRQTAEVEAALSADARRFADEHGLTVKPTIPQLRHMIGTSA